MNAQLRPYLLIEQQWDSNVCACGQSECDSGHDSSRHQGTLGKGKLRSPVGGTIYANVIWPGRKGNMLPAPAGELKRSPRSLSRKPGDLLLRGGDGKERGKGGERRGRKGRGRKRGSGMERKGEGRGPS